ncbi:MAG TPA: type II secretion system protein GspL [Noviherbaspirillum sp.]|uniref:type II secretion system protein GspL n=1 Tax=Noviherbaspirillum sp. TaxID=1926288 RepID=UPI002B48C0AA|nr:type II secretion system protein GspL [Noviherbaspirillum sp.]HJV87230.1 type II secretion system protein GspL [Noviherbaspirillum sp.]
MSTLYIRLPSHAAAESLQPGMPLYCEYASASNSGAVEREGVAALSELSEPAGRAQRVVLLLAASDVTLLRVKMPPLTGARLKAALPNLVEDQLMSDPSECIVVAGDMHEGVRTVAVVQRSWMEILNRTLQGLGARNVSALPAQLCLPLQGEAASAAVAERGTDADIAVRLAEQDGIGLSIAADQPESVAFEVLQAVNAVVPHGPVTLYVPQSRVVDYKESLNIAPPLQERIAIHADNWQRWIGGAAKTSINLMSGLGATAGPGFDWRPWRWPLVLLAAVLLINIIGLNVDWLRMKREADVLRTGMIQTYRSAFPKETVIIDPLAQLRQKLAAAQRESGQVAPDDFLALAAAVGEALTSAGKSGTVVAGLEYHDRGLTVKLKPDANVSIDQVKGALAARNLSVSQSGTGTWLVRSGK